MNTPQVHQLQWKAFFVRWFYGILLCSTPTWAFAQEGLYAQAQELAQEAQHQAAASQLTALLNEYPDYLPAQLLEAHNFAWWQRYDQAINRFKEILDAYPDHTEARIGLGYAYNWGGDWLSGLEQFRAVLFSNPDNLGALKGMGYCYLAGKNGESALKIFSDLYLDYPTDVEIAVGLAQSHLLQQHPNQARRVLKQSLQHSPGDPALEELLQRLPAQTAPLELDLWAGYSKVGVEDRLGLRILQAFYQLNSQVALFARYDNTLSLDNIDFVTRRAGVGAIWGGTLMGWNDRLGSKFEYGRRFFSDGARQHLLKAEQIFYTRSAVSARVGGFAGFSPDIVTEWFTYASLYLPIGELFALEPTYYFAKDGNSPKAQHRALLAGKFRHPAGYELTIGGFWGQTNLEIEQVPSTISGGYLIGIIPLSHSIQAQLAVNHEKGVFDPSTVIALGLKWKMGR